MSDEWFWMRVLCNWMLMFAIPVAITVVIINYFYNYIFGDVDWLTVLTSRNFLRYAICFFAIFFTVRYLLFHLPFYQTLYLYTITG